MGKVSNKIRLTRERVLKLRAPETGETTIWDTEVLGLGVRCLPSGVKSYIVSYRSKPGRAGIPRRVTLGKIEGLRLEDAREAALDIRSAVLKGRDPVEEQRAAKREAKRPDLMLGDALGRYYADQEKRGVVNQKSVQSSLDRHLLGHIGNQPLKEIDRRAVIEAVEALETQKRPDGKIGYIGAAAAVRSHGSTFLKWCADQGLIDANPLQGYRASRATRAQRVEKTGREVSEVELALIWRACAAETVNPAYGNLVRMLILAGQRRTETAHMRWKDVDLEKMVWRIPEGEAKNGVAHDVPLSDLAKSVLTATAKTRTSAGEISQWVFSTNGDAPISGFSKLDNKLRAVADTLAIESGASAGLERWTLHDLRRTFRSGMTRLGIDQDVAEIMLNHRPATLRTVYDRDPQMDARRDAGERWSNHVAAIVNPEAKANVIAIRGGK
jgi:integrase